MVAGSRCWLASGLPLSARSRQHRLCRIKCRTRRDDGVPAPARFRLCRRRPRRDDRAVYGGEHALPTDVTIGTADPGLSEWRKVTCGAFSGFPTNFGSLSHQLSPSCQEPSLNVYCPTDGNRRIKFSVAKMRLFISFHLCLHYTQVSQIKALHPKLRFHDLKMLASFEFGGLHRPSTHSHPACCQDGDGDSENDNWYVHGHIENFWGIASPDDQHIIIGSPLDILPVQKHKNNSNFLKYFHSFGLAIPNYCQSCMFFSLWLTRLTFASWRHIAFDFFISFFFLAGEAVEQIVDPLVILGQMHILTPL